jgi:alanine racemase
MTPVIRAIVDTAALRANLARIRALAPRSRVLAIIKANGYGHGSVPVALALADADGFGVARLEEGVALRAAGVRQRIVLLEGVFDAAQLERAAAHELDLVVHAPEQVALLAAWRGGHVFEVWIKIDTGMNRLGFRPEDLPAAHDALARCPGVRRAFRYMTHLASADERDAAATAAQIARFQRALGGEPGECSIANSAGILGYPAALADWVRPGLALYGASPFHDADATSLGLQPAMSLVTRVIALKRVLTGEAVGYGGVWRAPRNSLLAIAAAGYGDGYPRNVASGTAVLLAGRRAKVVGRVSMDMLAIDATDLPRPAVGDSVMLWGPGLPVEAVAAAAGTIAYELLCGVSQRVHLEVR